MTAEERELIEAQQRIIDAELAGDVAALERLIDPEFRGVDPGGRPQDRAQVLETYGSGRYTFERIAAEEVRCLHFGEAGVLTGIATMEGRTQRHAFRSRFRYTDVYVRRDGEWRAIASHASPVGD